MTMREKIKRLTALLNDKSYIRCLADYNRGHLSHANYLNERAQWAELSYGENECVKNDNKA